MSLFEHIEWPSVLPTPGLDLEEEVKALCRLMYFRKIAAMSYLYKPNEPADSIYIVLAGEVDVEEDLVSMNSNIKSRTCGPGDYFGHSEGTKRRTFELQRTGMAVARSDVEAICIDRADVERTYMSEVFDEALRMRERYLAEATGHLSGFFRGWEFMKEVDGVRVYKKMHLLTKAICFKGIGYVNKDHNEVSDYILNFDNRRDWDPLFICGQTFEKLDSQTELR
jgi:hypothetical protein